MMEAPRDYEEDPLRKYENWSVYLHESQTYLGRSYIALARGGEIDPFTETTDDEQAELLLIVNSLKSSIDKLYQPDLINYANLRNTWQHCHWHVIPRYKTVRNVLGHTFEDSNWGKNYAPYAKTTIPTIVFDKIKTDLSAELMNEQNIE